MPPPAYRFAHEGYEQA